MRKCFGAVSAAVCLSLLVGCTSLAPPPKPVQLPSTPLDGWVRLGTPWSKENDKGPAYVSPNGRYIAYETEEVFPGDTDTHPNQYNLYLLDRGTGDRHLIRDWLIDVYGVGDDGRVLVSYQESSVTPTLWAVYTIAGGLGPGFARPTPAGGCNISLEEGGTGIELFCHGSDTAPTGIYRFDPGDVVATPVQVTVGLTAHEIVVDRSPNHRYLLIGSDQTDTPRVYDTQTDTLLPYTIDQPLVAPYGVTEFYVGGVYDDGRMMVNVYQWGINLDATYMGWFDPRTANIEYFVGYGNVTGGGFRSTDYLILTDYTREIGRHFWREGRAGDLDVDRIIGSFTSPTTRWRLPHNAALLAIGADGAVVVRSDLPLDPNDPSPGTGIYVREGPLPPPPQ